MILGLDFLCNYAATVDFGQGTVTIANSTVKLGQPRVAACTIRATSAITVPRRSGMTVRVKCSKQLPGKFMHVGPMRRAVQSDRYTVLDTVTTTDCPFIYLGFIEPSTSEWRSPVVLVKKPDGSWRFCCDYRKLNAVTRPQSFPLPRLEDVWDAVGASGAKVFSVVDMSSGFNQCAMDPDARHKTAFVTQSGQYQWNVLPYGLCNSPATFTRTINQVLHSLIYRICTGYVDDIMCYSKNMADHLDHLEEVFTRIKAAGLKLNPSKCTFAAKEVKYLGHILSAKSIRPDPQKLDIVATYPTPKTVKEVRSFLGLANYYKRFTRDYSKIAAPLHKLLRKGVTFQWSEQCQQAFEELRSRLVSHPIIGFPDMNKPFTLTTDASGTGLGYVLSQKDKDGEVVIAYGGRAIRDAETRYSASEREMLAVKEGIKAYSPYLSDRKFTLVTDHQPLKYMERFQPATKRLCDMALYLQGYTFDVIYKEGKTNCNADTISRRPYQDT